MRTFTKDDVKPNFCDGKVTVPRCFYNIDANAFKGCGGVQQIDFAGPIDFNYKAFSSGLFRDCVNLKKVMFRIMPTFTPFRMFIHCPSPKIDLYLPGDNIDEVKKEYSLCKALNAETYKTEICFHKILDLGNSGKV